MKSRRLAEGEVRSSSAFPVLSRGLSPVQRLQGERSPLHEEKTQNYYNSHYFIVSGGIGRLFYPTASDLYYRWQAKQEIEAYNEAAGQIAEASERIIPSFGRLPRRITGSLRKGATP